LNWKYQVGDYLVLRKKHPCGSFRWEVLRLGSDIRLLCTECGRMVTLSRLDLERRIKAVEKI
jgi:hypothetical protein